MIPPAEGILLCCCLSLLEQESRRWEGAWIPALAAGRLGGRWGQLEEGGLSGEEASEALLSMSPPAELTEQSGLCFQTEDGEGREGRSEEKLERQTCTSGISTCLSLQAPGSPWNAFLLHRPGF